MAQKTTFHVSQADIQEALRRLSQMEPKRMKNANKAMFRAAVSALKRETIKKMKAAWPGATRVSKRYARTGMPSGVKGVSTWIGRDGYGATVSIKYPFLSEIFNIGSKERYTKGKSMSAASVATKRFGKRYKKKGLYRGRIQATNFFQSAQESVNPEVERIMHSSFVKNVTKAWEGQ